ncbi:50S ribosomal protein L17 [Candidatus Gracilibacteria bacterium]|jgi:large subunit ribosomal protein L17|nr:50S ribosomal protein L17 [Candidatus Gracilibacteria bacterium]
MRHRVKKHLHLNGKDKAHRKSVVRSLISGLFEHKSIVTTEKRALAIEPVSHKLIELVKSGQSDYNKIRLISPEVHTEAASRAILEIGSSYKDRNGGYTRITPIKYRDGDGALLVKLELV